MFYMYILFRKKKLISNWKQDFRKIDNRDTIVTYAEMSAFKFPEHMQVFLTCNVEVYL